MKYKIITEIKGTLQTIKKVNRLSLVHSQKQEETLEKVEKNKWKKDKKFKRSKEKSIALEHRNRRSNILSCL